MNVASKTEDIKIAIVGGGLAGCLAAHWLRAEFPNASIRLFESSNKLCGEHTWCLHQSDVPEKWVSLIATLISRTWDHYNVYFPKFQRKFLSSYLCVRSVDLAKKTTLLPKLKLHFNCAIEILGPNSLSTGREALDLDFIFDCRGWPARTQGEKFTGFQKFYGMEVELASPHGLAGPVIMDATIKQRDGFGFMYILPFSEKTMLIEDTYYSTRPEIDRKKSLSFIRDYCLARDWQIEQITYEEIGSLDIPLRKKSVELVAPTLGAKADRYQAVTGYSFPFILSDLVQISELMHAGLNSSQILTWQKKTLPTQNWRNKFYLILNRMMFVGAADTERYKILQRFYELDESLIQRFYSGLTSKKDAFRILLGRPPIKLSKAISAVFSDSNLRRLSKKT